MMIQERREVEPCGEQFINAEIVHNVLKVPSLVDAQHEEKEDKADGVPGQALGVLV